MSTAGSFSPPLRAVGYRRVSMREQVDGFSLDAQENNIARYAEDHGWELLEIYYERKSLLRLAIGTGYLRKNAFAAVEPTLAFLPNKVL